MSMSAAGSSSSSRDLAPYQGPYLSPVGKKRAEKREEKEERGTRKFLQIAREYKWLESRGGSTLNPKPKPTFLEDAVAADMRLRIITPLLDVKSLSRLTAASKALYSLKADAMKKRGDAAADLIRYLKGDLPRPCSGDNKALIQALKKRMEVLTDFVRGGFKGDLPRSCSGDPDDIEVLKTIESLDLSGIPLNPEKIRTIVQRCPNVKELDLSGCGLTHECTRELIPLQRQLVSLKLHDNAFLRMSFVELAYFPNLKKIVAEELLGAPGDPAMLAETVRLVSSSLGQLESIRLVAHFLDARDISRLIPLLKFCPSLKELIIEDVTVNEAQLLEISQFKNLKVLRLGNDTYCSERALQEIGKMTGLRELKITLQDGVTNLEPLFGLTNLQTLALRDISAVTKEELQKLIPVLRNLTELSLARCVLKEKELLAILVECPKLKKLHLESCPNITGKHFHRLSVLPQLEAVEFDNCHQLRGYIFNSLARCKTVTKLDLDDCKRIGFEEVGGVEPFGFKRLAIKDCYFKIQIKRYEELVARCPQLQELEIICNFETDGLAADALFEKIIPHCKGVRKMKLVLDTLGNSALRRLAELSNLQLLDYEEDADFEIITQETRQFLKSTLPSLVILRDGKKEFPADLRVRVVDESRDSSDSDSDGSGSSSSGSDVSDSDFSDSEIDSSDSDDDAASARI